MSNAALRPVSLTMTAWADLDEGELVDGALQAEEMPDVVHEKIVVFLIRLFGAWVERHGGQVFGSELKLAVAARRGRKPDLSVFLPRARLPHGRDRVVKVPPSIVIEVITDTPRDVRRDRIEKAGEYATFGVRYYWLVDPEHRTVEIFERNKRTIAVMAGKVRVPGCKGLTFDVTKLWNEVDALLD